MNHETRDTELERALEILAEGHPAENEPHSTGTGELDNGKVRLALASAAFLVVERTAPRDVFDQLAGYFDRSQLSSWFGKKRAELILQMLLFQTGWTEYSTWLSLIERRLNKLETRPDLQWRDLCARLGSDDPRLNHLAAILAKQLPR